MSKSQEELFEAEILLQCNSELHHRLSKNELPQKPIGTSDLEFARILKELEDIVEKQKQELLNKLQGEISVKKGVYEHIRYTVFKQDYFTGAW